MGTFKLQLSLQLRTYFLYVGLFAIAVTVICVMLSWRYLNK